MSVRQPSHRFHYSLLLVLCLSLPACVRYDDEETQKPSGNVSLEEIKRQLDQPYQPSTPTPEPTADKGRWKAYGNRSKQADTGDQERKLAAEIVQSQASAVWPPGVGRQFPLISFLNANGQKRSMEEFRGRLVLVEYVWMASSVSQAFSGSNERGPFGTVAISREYKSLEKYFPEYSGGTQAHELILLQILMADPASHPVTPATAQSWVKHFDLESRGRTVVIGSPALLRNEGSELLGGFQLLDKNLVVRVDATRERSKTLFSELFPAIGRLRN